MQLVVQALLRALLQQSSALLDSASRVSHSEMLAWLNIILGLGAIVHALPNHEQVPLEAGMTRNRPNVVFILTDDQDLHMSSLDYMPYLKKHLLDEGTFFQRHYCTIALCCPSRVSLWTGKAAHNTNVTDVNPPYGMHYLSMPN